MTRSAPLGGRQTAGGAVAEPERRPRTAPAPQSVLAAAVRSAACRLHRPIFRPCSEDSAWPRPRASPSPQRRDASVRRRPPARRACGLTSCPHHAVGKSDGPQRPGPHGVSSAPLASNLSVAAEPSHRHGPADTSTAPRVSRRALVAPPPRAQDLRIAREQRGCQRGRGAKRRSGCGGGALRRAHAEGPPAPPRARLRCVTACVAACAAMVRAPRVAPRARAASVSARIERGRVTVKAIVVRASDLRSFTPALHSVHSWPRTRGRTPQFHADEMAQKRHAHARMKQHMSSWLGATAALLLYYMVSRWLWPSAVVHRFTNDAVPFSCCRASR